MEGAEGWGGRERREGRGGEDGKEEMERMEGTVGREEGKDVRIIGKEWMEGRATGKGRGRCDGGKGMGG